jgi:hypothetical protein
MAGVALALGALMLAGCATTATPAPTTGDVSVVEGVVIGCISFEQTECEAVATQVLRALPPARGMPFSMALQLFDCQNGGACAKSLRARDGQATVEYANGGEPILLGLAGPPESATLQPIDAAWSGLQQPGSVRVVGRGPFELQLGHCGLNWQVDFDGSFWVPVGQVDGGASAIVNAESGQILLLGPNLAVFSDSRGFTAGLQRFPGLKRVFLCA